SFNATAFFLVMALPALALDNGLMRTPPMGWMSWERFRSNVHCVNDPKNCIRYFYRLAEDGWKNLGYNYLIIDDCWSFILRDNGGRLLLDMFRFSLGILKLARYIHDCGLKLGIYANLGTHMCFGFPDTTLDKIELHTQTFASWGVDMLKFDGLDECQYDLWEYICCFMLYPLVSKALNATECPIAYSCSWPVYRGGLPPSVNYTLLGEICSLCRNYEDIKDSWDSVLRIVDWFFNNICNDGTKALWRPLSLRPPAR
uniref:Alpha-galactosidase n=1 Tax=Electrophorus electricus TaxID=8005 RepID=A0A4W4FCQ5_ELEEL